MKQLINVLPFLLSLCYMNSAAPTYDRIDIRMPHVHPTKADTYLCTSIDATKIFQYVIEFIPKANKEIAHHILLYGCYIPGSKDRVWECGEMVRKGENALPVCQSGAQIIYAWAMDAPNLKLPQDVAFKVGADTAVKTLTMQVHYKNVSSFLPPASQTDSSGLTLVTTRLPKSRLAGVYLMATGGMIPAHSNEYFEVACPFPREDVEIHPFAYRTHAHSLGRVISGYRVRNGKWTEIGRMDPREPQMFYNVTSPMTVRYGDFLVARCTMENDQDHDVYVGPTREDEMCNFYIMYFTEGDKTVSDDVCLSPGPPSWFLPSYSDVESLNLRDMPRNASIIPDTKEIIYPTRSMATTTDTDYLDDTERLLENIFANISPEEVLIRLHEIAYPQRHSLGRNRFYDIHKYLYPQADK